MIEVTLFAGDIWSAGLKVKEKCHADPTHPPSPTLQRLLCHESLIRLQKVTNTLPSLTLELISRLELYQANHFLFVLLSFFLSNKSILLLFASLTSCIVTKVTLADDSVRESLIKKSVCAERHQLCFWLGGSLTRACDEGNTLHFRTAEEGDTSSR